MSNPVESKQFMDQKIAYPFSVSLEVVTSDLDQLRQVTSPLVVLIGEHPQEGLAFRVGKKTHSRLIEGGVSVSLERFPAELSEVGSVVKGLEPINESKVRIPLLRALYGRYSSDAYFFHFHNSVYDAYQEKYGPPKLEHYELAAVTYPKTEEFTQVKGCAFEIPAVWKPSGNTRLQEYGALKAHVWVAGFDQKELDLYIKMISRNQPELIGEDLLNAAKKERDRMHAGANSIMEPEGPGRGWSDVEVDFRQQFTRVTDLDKSNQLIPEQDLINLLIHRMNLYISC